MYRQREITDDELVALYVYLLHGHMKTPRSFLLNFIEERRIPRARIAEIEEQLSFRRKGRIA